MFRLDDVVPWGRELDEYAAMFDLDLDAWPERVLGCSDGPASFNAEASARGLTVCSCDPIYVFPKEAIAHRIEVTRDRILEQTHANREEFVWRRFRDPEEVALVRMRAMQPSFSTTSTRASARGATSPPPCRACPFPSARSIWRSAHTSSSSIPSSAISISTLRHCGS